MSLRIHRQYLFEHARGVEDEDLVAERPSLVMGPRSGEAESDPSISLGTFYFAALAMEDGYKQVMMSSSYMYNRIGVR